MALEDYKDIVAAAASITTIAQFFSGMWVYIFTFILSIKGMVVVFLSVIFFRIDIFLGIFLQIAACVNCALMWLNIFFFCVF